MCSSWKWNEWHVWQSEAQINVTIFAPPSGKSEIKMNSIPCFCQPAKYLMMRQVIPSHLVECSTVRRKKKGLEKNVSLDGPALLEGFFVC